MSHVRKQIRDRISEILASGVTLVSGRVYPSRIYPLSEDNLPCVAVYTSSEESGLRTMGTVTIERQLLTSVDAVVRVSDSFDDDVDALCVQIEEAIAADFTLSGLVKDIVLSSTEIDFDSDAERPIGIARLTFACRYVTTVGDVETAR